MYDVNEWGYQHDINCFSFDTWSSDYYVDIMTKYVHNQQAYSMYDHDVLMKQLIEVACNLHCITCIMVCVMKLLY